MSFWSFSDPAVQLRWTEGSCTWRGVHNPLLEQWLKAGTRSFTPWADKSGCLRFGGRGDPPLVCQYAWAIPCPEALDVLAALSPLVEMGAGTGYWAHLLQKGGADVLPFDSQPYSNHQAEGRFTEVSLGGSEIAGSYPERVLFLCWPPNDDPMGAAALEAHHAAGGQQVAYIGEGDGGCTADDRFHTFLEEHYREVRRVELPQWYGIHDDLGVYARKF